MRKLTFIIATLILAAVAVDASAQQVVKKRIGVYKENGNVVVAEAVTTLALDVTVEREEFVPGPYARYAQKLLGKRASLVERVQYKVVNADIAVLADDAFYAKQDIDNGSVAVAAAEELLQIDRMSSTEKSPDAQADSAADQIFALRSARLELISGELGDGVFGGGLESALNEINRLEQAYLELFYGKRMVTRSTHRVLIDIEQRNKSYVAARFSSDDGLVSKNDIAGELLMVTINPSKMEYPYGDDKGVVAYCYANNSEVIVSLGQTELVKRILPIYEFGEMVMYANPR